VAGFCTAVDTYEVGIAPAQKPETERINARQGSDAALVSDLAISREHRKIQPGI
jgi:hypothetical protein